MPKRDVMEEKKRYSIIRPTESRDRFTLSCYIIEGRKRIYCELPAPIKKQALQINEKYKSGLITNLDAETLLNDVIQNAYKSLNIKHVVLKNSVISEVNQKIFNKFWDKVYKDRYLEDEKSPKYSILKALKLIEPLSIQTATASQLQAKLKDSGVSVPVNRRATDSLNQILRYLNRDFKLNKPKPERTKVKHLTLAEFSKVLHHISDPVLKDFAMTLFATGMRLSEALAVNAQDIKGSVLNIDKQLRPSGSKNEVVDKDPKRGSKGHVVVLPFGKDALKRWASRDDKNEYRFQLYPALMKACQKVFPKQTDNQKWLSPHDLRHSHAIHLLSKGANLTQVALNLRNRIDVCQKYYTGFEHTDSSLDGLLKMVK